MVDAASTRLVADDQTHAIARLAYDAPPW